MFESCFVCCTSRRQVCFDVCEGEDLQWREICHEAFSETLWILTVEVIESCMVFTPLGVVHGMNMHESSSNLSRR